MVITWPSKIIDRVEGAKPHPVIFIFWILLIATIRYSLEIVLVDRFDVVQYIYHSLYYVTIFLFIPTLLLYLITREDIDRVINVVAFLIFPFKILSVTIDRLILGNMQAYHYIQGKPAFLLKYVFLNQGQTPYISTALAVEWIIISVLVGLYAAYKLKILWLAPVFALVSHTIIVFSGAFVNSVISPVVGDIPLGRLGQVFHLKLPKRHALIEVNTELKDFFLFYGSLFAAASFILFLIYAAIYLKERRTTVFKRLWWTIPCVGLIGPFITRPLHVYDAIMTSLALLAILLFAGFGLFHRLLQGNEKIWSYLIFLAYSLLFTIYYTSITYLIYILGFLIAITTVLSLRAQRSNLIS